MTALRPATPQERLSDESQPREHQRPRPQIADPYEQLRHGGKPGEGPEERHGEENQPRHERGRTSSVARGSIDDGDQQEPDAETERDRRPAREEALERRLEEKCPSEAEQDPTRQKRPAEAARRREREEDRPDQDEDRTRSGEAERSRQEEERT